MAQNRSNFVVVANRLPVDRHTDPDGHTTWRTSPGGLVAALEPVMKSVDGAWVGWIGAPDDAPDPFDLDGMRLVPVPLSEDEIAEYYEGFSNDTIWPLYHDVIATPQFHREWWQAYQRVNKRFAEAAASVADTGATVWVHDYQLQLVPQYLRALRPDVTIGYFHHIPFPGHALFMQLPWRRQVLQGLLGADVIGFQRGTDAYNFVRCVKRRLDVVTRGNTIVLPDAPEYGGPRRVDVGAFPISIDTAPYAEMANDPAVQERAAEIREGLGNPKTILLGVDRLDYTKGIRHRIKAFGELLREGKISVNDVILVQVASPSRERVDSYVQLRDEIELMVARINGDLDTMDHTAIRYLHQGFGREEMGALYMAADVMLVTALRDGMNLVAKEYVASRIHNDGALILSEFAGAADELTQALLVNPHDIEGLKEAYVRAINMSPAEQRRRMRSLRKKVLENDVANWANAFLAALDNAARRKADAS